MEINLTAHFVTCLFAVVIFNSHGVFSRSRSAAYDMNRLPKFLPSRNNFTYKKGQVAVLNCAVTNLGKKKVIWRRASDSTPLTVGYMSFNEDPRYAVEHASDNWNLIIREVKKSDAGVYECQVSSRMRHLRQHVTLLVVDAEPPRSLPTKKPKIEISGSNYVDEGNRIFLKCNATSREYPPEEIDWFRSGNALATDEDAGMYIRKLVTLQTGTIVSTLEIKHAKLTDQGTYVCRTSNRDVTSININVLKGVGTHDYVKRNTEKKVGEDASYRGQRGNSGCKLTSNTLFMLVVSLMASVVTSRGLSFKEIT